MMPFVLLIPIGHESATVNRLPWVTIGIAVLCVLVQMRACVVEPQAHEAYERLEHEIAEAEEVVARHALLSSESAGAGAGPAAAAENAELDAARLELAAQEIDEEAGLPTEEELSRAQERLHTLRAAQQAEIDRLPSAWLGYRPGQSRFWTLFSYAFAHGGWGHLLGNMLFLYLVGCNMEDRWGRLRYSAFYLLGALVSALAFRLWHPAGETGLVGASGAIAAAMGAFTLCYASTEIRFFYAYWITLKPRAGTFATPAWVALPVWFLQQVLWSLFEAGGNLGVAYSAHVGGFVFGAAVALALRLSGEDARLLAAAEQPKRPEDEWSEDPQFVDATVQARNGNRSGALAVLERMLESNREHAEARALALDLALAVGSLEQVQTHAGEAFALWLRRGQREHLFAHYRALRQARAELELGEVALRQVIAAARPDLDPVVPIDAASQLIRQHPGSAFLPRALWVAAEAQERLPRPDLARRTLENIIAAFPMDPFADEARKKLK